MSPTQTPRRPLAAAVIAAAAVAFARPASSAIVTIGRPQDDGPDAELIALCADFRASEAEFNRTLNGAAVPDEQAEAICERTTARWDGMLARMEKLPAATPDGFAAVALCLAQHSCQLGYDYAFAFDPKDGTVTGRLLHMTLQNGARLAAAGRAA